MFGKKLVSDALLATVKEVTSGEQIDSSGNELLIGDGVTVQEGPHAGRTGMISGFQNTGRSEVQLDHGPSVAIYNEVLLNEGLVDKIAGKNTGTAGVPNTRLTRGADLGAKIHKKVRPGAAAKRQASQDAAVSATEKGAAPTSKTYAQIGRSFATRSTAAHDHNRKIRNARARAKTAGVAQSGSTSVMRSASEDYEVDEAMSPAEIIRRRKEQKREVVRGKRKSGKTSDKLYDYGIRKSEGKPVNVPKQQKTEEEYIDELSKKTLGSYVKKSSQDMKSAQKAAGRTGPQVNKWGADHPDTTYTVGHAGKHLNKRQLTKRVNKRQAGINKAADRLSNEEYEIEYEELVFDQLLLDSLLAEAGFDAIDKKALKKKWKDREDQDIDNDGDEDESDRFLHKRRKAISKSKKGEKIEINPEIKEAIRKLIHSTLK